MKTPTYNLSDADLTKIAEAKEALASMLPWLVTSSHPSIKFGDPNNPDGYLTHHVITYIMTPGGKQFCLREVNAMGSTSGIYAYDETEMLAVAQRALARFYNRMVGVPVEVRKKLEERKLEVPCSYFFTPPGTEDEADDTSFSLPG